MNTEKKRRLNLKLDRPEDVRRSVSRVINMVLNEEIETPRANCIYNGCNVLLNSLRLDEVQRRIDDQENADYITAQIFQALKEQ